MPLALTLAGAWLALATAAGILIGRALHNADTRGCPCGGCNEPPVAELVAAADVRSGWRA